MFTLIAMGTGVAYIYSVVAVLAPQIFPPAFPRARRLGRGLFRGRRGHHRAGAARAGTGTARARTDLGAIRALLDLAPKTARRVADDGSDAEVPLDSVVAGDRLRVRPGDKVPVDGELIEGAPRSMSRW